MKFDDIKANKDIKAIASQAPIDSKVYGKEVIVKKFEKLGWNLAGSGHFALVFENPNKNYVIRVEYNKDLGFEEFYEFVKNHKCKYLPKIKKDSIRNGGEIKNIYLIEKLMPLKDEKLKTIIINLFNDWHPTEKDKILLKKYPRLEEFIEYMVRNIGDKTLDIHEDNLMQRADKTPIIIDAFYNNI